jgi:hypothetical protein
MKKDLSFVSTIAQFTEIGLQQIGLKNKAFAACHTHPPYSSDLVPCDFCLFPTVKEKLERIQVGDKEQFFEPLHEILKGIDQRELDSLFQPWVQRIQEGSQGNGDYVR